MPRRTPTRRNSSRRRQGAASAAGVRAAQHRLFATLGRAEDSGHPEGLLELPAGPAPGAAGHERKPGTARLRRRTGLRAAVLLGAVAVLICGWFWWRAGTGAPEVIPLSDVSVAGAHGPGHGPDGGNTDPAEEASAAPSARRILVHVAGAVATPGVVEVPEGSRLHEAIAAAGGSLGTADPDRLNLAAVVEDGQKIFVPERGGALAAEPAPGDAGGAAMGVGGTGAAVGKINLNTAGVEELGSLPRVGPVLAQRIVDWRKEHGRFQTVEDLDAVDGVGPKLMAALLPLVRV